MTLIVLAGLAGLGAFGYFAWKHGVTEAVAAFVGFGAGAWALLTQFADKF